MPSLLTLLEVTCVWDTIPYYANIWLESRTQKQWLMDYERTGFFECRWSIQALDSSRPSALEESDNVEMISHLSASACAVGCCEY